MDKPNSNGRRKRSNNSGGYGKKSFHGGGRGGGFGGRGRGGGGGRGRSGGGGRGGRKGQYINPEKFVKAAKPIEQTTYEPTHSFEDFDLDELIKRNLRDRGFTTPTQIQDQSIPVALEGHDVVGIANTGTGKTAAFLLPALTKLMRNKQAKILAIAPTRELALQIQEESRVFARSSRMNDVLIIGGTPMHKQINALKRKPQIIIGTPGRIKDHLERKTLKLDQVQTVVLDEVDRMLDMGFVNDIRHILGHLPQKRQSLFFSATMNKTIEGLIGQFTYQPQTIMAKTAETSDNVEQDVIHYARADEKKQKLHSLLNHPDTTKTLIFTETRRAADFLSKDLYQSGFKSDAMHGSKSQSQRQRALKKFRDDQLDILVATDVAARGIDVDGVTHVINYDLPQSYDDYTHRIGRAGRSNNKGYAFTFVNKR